LTTCRSKAMSAQHPQIRLVNVGFTGLLTLVFITLKLCKVIDWSWVWVLSPLWITAGILLAVALLVLVVFFRT